MTELEKKILNDIDKTGFAAELSAASTLKRNGWFTSHANTYLDKELNKSREIDLISHKAASNNELKFDYKFHLVIEVKKSEKHWIIFTTDRVLSSTGWQVLNSGKNDHKPLRPNEFYLRRIFDDRCTLEFDPRNKIERVGSAFHEFSKKGDEPSKIYAALIGCCKAAQHFCNTSKVGGQSVYIKDQRVVLNIFIPLVIFDGLLFEVYSNYQGEIKIEQKEYIPIVLSHTSFNDLNETSDTKFLPEIVTLKGLPEYLEQINKWQNSIRNTCDLLLQEYIDSNK